MLFFSTIITNELWSFDKHPMVLECYNKDSNGEVMPFNSTHFLVQVHGIPIRWIHRWQQGCTKPWDRYYVNQNHQLKTGVALWGCVYLSTYHNLYVEVGWLFLRIIRNNGSPSNMSDFPTSTTGVGAWHIMIEIVTCGFIVKVLWRKQINDMILGYVLLHLRIHAGQ